MDIWRRLKIGFRGAIIGVVSVSVFSHDSWAAQDDLTLARDLARRSADVVLRRDPARMEGTKYGELGYSCIALLRTAAAFGSQSPDLARRYADYAYRIADHLVRDRDMNRDGKVGWGLDADYTDQTTKITIPAHQEYAYQTGVASLCLLEAQEQSGNELYGQTVRAALTTFWDMATERVDSRCKNCAYFWYSTHPNYFGRYIKNTNVLLGMTVARMARITGDGRYRARALSVLNSERFEINTLRNFSYFGARDPRFREFADRHMAPEMWAIDEISRDLGIDVGDTLRPMAAYFWNCGERCAARATTVPGILAGCALAQYGDPSRANCSESLRAYNPPSAQQAVSSFALIGVVRALNYWSDPR